MNKLLLFIITATFLSACGTEPLAQVDPLATEHPRLRLITASNPAAMVGPKQSYLVAFKDPLSNPRQHYMGLRDRSRSHRRAFGSQLTADVLGEQLRYLGSLNLTRLGASFHQTLPSLAPSFIKQDLPEGEDAMASLVELNFASAEEAESVLKKWLAEDRIYYAEPNGSSTLSGAVEEGIISQFKPSLSMTPWLEQVNYIEALQRMSALSSVAEPVIAVMDSGVDVLHPNLRDSIFVNEQGQNKLCKDDIYGCNTTVAVKEILGDGNVFPSGTNGFNESCKNNKECEHGTHVAGIISARKSTQFVGLCPYCKILVVKVVEVEEGDGEQAFVIKDASIIAGLAYVSGFKAGGEPLVRVINASFGKFEKSRSVELFIKALRNFGRGTLMVGAAGNEDTMKRQYPAGFESVVAVANVRSNRTDPAKSSSSNFGVWVDISAPGDGFCPSLGGSGILSTTPGNEIACKIGTSMASPVVSGIAGLVLAKEPNITAADLERRLLETALPDVYTISQNSGYRPTIRGLGVVPLLGSGVVNAAAALDPEVDASPPLNTSRSDLVRLGCGVIRGVSHSSNQWAWLYLLMPIILFLMRRFK